MNSLYKTWSFFTLLLIPALLFLLFTAVKPSVNPSQNATAKERLAQIRQSKTLTKQREIKAHPDPSTSENPPANEWVVMAPAPRLTQQPPKPDSNPPLATERQRPVQLPPLIPANSALIGGSFAHPTRIMVKMLPGETLNTIAPILQSVGMRVAHSTASGSIILEAVPKEDDPAEQVAQGGQVDQGGQAQDGQVQGAQADIPDFQEEVVPVEDPDSINLMSLDLSDNPEALEEVLHRGQALKDKLEQMSQSGKFEYIEPDHVITTTAKPSDSYFVNGTDWGKNNYGQSRGKAGIDINVIEAWDITTGSSDVIVAVIDTGIRYTHQDLKKQMWINTDEIPGNGRDDDGDGYVDNIYGMDAHYNDGDPWDGRGHGTHCAGTIGAAANDGNPHVGVNWKVRLMACKMMSDGGWGYWSSAVKAIDFAVDNGAKVLSNSYGGSGYSSAVYNAIKRAKDKGVIFIASAGNGYSNADYRPSYPAAFDLDNIISVAAIDWHGNKARWSNYGKKSVDMGAPGVRIISTLAWSDSAYGFYSGTSMACPHVAGVAALLYADSSNTDWESVKIRMMLSTKPLDSMKNITVSGGMVDAFAAVSSGEEDGDLELRVTTSTKEGNPFVRGREYSIYVSVRDLKRVTGATVKGSIEGIGDLTFKDDGQAPDKEVDDATYSAKIRVPTDSSMDTLVLNLTVTATGKNNASLAKSYTVVGAPANDNYADRFILKDKYNNIIVGYTFGATLEKTEASSGFSKEAGSIWYEWTSKTAGPVQFDTMGSNSQTYLSIYTKTGFGLTLAAKDNRQGGWNKGHWDAKIIIQAAAGTTYYIRIATPDWDPEGTVKGHVIAHNLDNPPNDNFAEAAPLALPEDSLRYLLTGSTFAATEESGEKSLHSWGTAGHSVWYLWTPKLDYRVKLTPQGGHISSRSYWPAVVVFTDGNLDNLFKVAESPYVYQTMSFNVDAGKKYYIVVDSLSWNGLHPEEGAFRMLLDVEPIYRNDDFAESVLLTSNESKTLAENVWTDKEPDEPNHAGNQGGKSLWWHWICPSDGTVGIDTVGSTFDTILAVYTGESLDELTEVVSDDDGASNYRSRVNFNVKAGTTYRVAVDGKYMSEYYWTDEGKVCLNFLHTPTTTSSAVAVAVDDDNGTYTTGGNGQWYSQTVVYKTGGKAAASANIKDGSETWLETTIEEEGVYSFFWKVSSEKDADHLILYVDGVEKGRISGEKEESVSVDLEAGTHTIRWLYSKDSSLSDGQDKAWLDQVSFTSTLALPVYFSGYLSNLDEENRKWMSGINGGAFYISRNGDVYKSKLPGSNANSAASSGGELVGKVNSSFFDNPGQLTWPDVKFAKYHEEKDESDRKWLTDAEGQWYHIDDQGRIYAWIDDASDGELIGRVNKDRYTNPQLLVSTSVSYAAYYPEHDASDAKWLKDFSGNWHFITPAGGLYEYVEETKSNILIGGTKPGHFLHPQLLIWPTVIFTKHFADDDEASKKWFSDANGVEYYVTADGHVYLTEQNNGDQLIGGVDKDCFNQPSLLVVPSGFFAEQFPEWDSEYTKWFTSTLGQRHYIDEYGSVSDHSSWTKHFKHNGAVSEGVTLAADRHGNANSAYDFNWGGMNVPDAWDGSLDPVNMITLSAWVHLGPGGGFPGGIFGTIVGKGIDNDYQLRMNDAGKFAFLVRVRDQDGGESVVRQIYTPDAYSAGTWYHVAATYDGVAMKLYVNGVEKASGACSGSLIDSEYPVQIGKRPNGYHFDGKIDEVGIWNSALSADQISSLHGNDDYITGFTGLVAYYPFNGNPNNENSKTILRLSPKYFYSPESLLD